MERSHGIVLVAILGMSAEPSRAHSPHDRFFHYVFERPEAMAIKLRQVLPPELLAHLDLGSLETASTLYTNPRLRGRASDLCFSANLSDGETTVRAHLLVEHQSTRDALSPWRALVYAGEFWGRSRRARPKDALSLIIPVVFLQHPAQDTPLQLSPLLDVPPRLREVVGAPFEARLFVGDFSGSVLDDPVAPLHVRALVELASAFLHAYKNASALTDARIAELAPLFDVVRERSGPDDIQALWTYLVEVFEEGSPLCERIGRAVSQPVREEYMTIKEMLIREGYESGRREGLESGRREGLESGRREGLESGRVAGKAEALLDVLELRTLAVPPWVRERVLATCDEPLLRRWLARAYTVGSAEELLASAEA